MIDKNPVGYFDKVLAMDCETTGLCFSNNDPHHNKETGEAHQAVSWGLIIADADTLEPIEELYVEIQWNDKSISQRKDSPEFGKIAEGIHGLSYQHLETHGISEFEAVEKIGELILKHWGPNGRIATMGHNVHTFDLPFFRDVFQRHGIELKFGSRHYDSNSLGFGTVGAFNSDDLFATVGLEERTTHNALDDAHMSLESFRRIRTLWDSRVGVKSYV